MIGKERTERREHQVERQLECDERDKQLRCADGNCDHELRADQRNESDRDHPAPVAVPLQPAVTPAPGGDVRDARCDPASEEQDTEQS